MERLLDTSNLCKSWKLKSPPPFFGKLLVSAKCIDTRMGLMSSGMLREEFSKRLYFKNCTVRGSTNKIISSVQWLSCVWLFATPWTAARQASLSITNSQSLLRLKWNYLFPELSVELSRLNWRRDSPKKISKLEFWVKKRAFISEYRRESVRYELTLKLILCIISRIRDLLMLNTYWTFSICSSRFSFYSS